MKKFLKVIIPIVIIGFLGFMSYKVITKINHKREVAEHIKTIPSFSYSTVNGKMFTHKNLEDNKPTLFLYFNSECEHCQSEASQIQENMPNFKNYQLVFVSFEEKNKIIAFAKKYKLDPYDNITFLVDKQVTFSTTFDVNSLPTMILYNKNEELIEKIKGQTKIETILKKLKK
jgi:peroxiredoxin